MYPFVAQSGVTTAVLDLTNQFEPLLIGLIGLLWFSASMIFILGMREYITEAFKRFKGTKPIGEILHAKHLPGFLSPCELSEKTHVHSDKMRSTEFQQEKARNLSHQTIS